MELRCARCQVKHVRTCRQCHIHRCTQCQQAEQQCEICGVSITSTPNLEDSDDWATSCVGARSRRRRLLHPESTLCEGDPGAWRRGIVVSSSSDRVQGVSTMQCSKRKRWLPPERMEKKATFHMRSVCSGTECRTSTSARTQKSEYWET